MAEIESSPPPEVHDIPTEVQDAPMTTDQVIKGDSDETKKEAESEIAIDADAGKEGAASGDIDPYAYLNRTEFTSERFKIEILNLPKRFGIGVRFSDCLDRVLSQILQVHVLTMPN